MTSAVGIPEDGARSAKIHSSFIRSARILIVYMCLFVSVITYIIIIIIIIIIILILFMYLFVSVITYIINTILLLLNRLYEFVCFCKYFILLLLLF